MKLIDYVKDQFKDGPELFVDEKIITNNKGVTITRNTERLRKMSIGLVSCNNSKEWYNLCRQVCEPGTVIEDYTDEWNQLYDDYLVLVRNTLTMRLIQERRDKGAKTLLDILTRRDREHWAEQKDVNVSGNEQDIVKISIVGA